MDDELAKLRALTRARLGLIWEMVQYGAELEGEEAVLADILKEHPEYHSIWENAATQPSTEEILIDGANPFAHVHIHQVVENQIADRTLPQVAQTLEALTQAGHSRHDAIHAIGNVLAQEMFDIMRDQCPFDEAGYVKALRNLAKEARRPGKRRNSRRKKRR